MRWQPCASKQTLQFRARAKQKVRAFFDARSVLEVDVPLLGSCTVTDIHLEPIVASVNGRTGYLQTSPEFFMKRLLAAGSDSIYFLGQAFRDDERGSRHQPEFTMLEWYRLGFDDEQLIAEVLELLKLVIPNRSARRVTYRALFEEVFSLNPHTISQQRLSLLALKHCQPSFTQADRNTWLDLLFTHCLEPRLHGLVVVEDFPASQSALARTQINDQGDWVAKRFEFYADGLELGNGYWELTNVEEQRQRFLADQAMRREQGNTVPEIDAEFMAAMAEGLPDCAGVAIGFDRLLMAALGAETIEQTLAFAPFGDS